MVDGSRRPHERLVGSIARWRLQQNLPGGVSISQGVRVRMVAGWATSEVHPYQNTTQQEARARLHRRPGYHHEQHQQEPVGGIRRSNLPGGGAGFCRIVDGGGAGFCSVVDGGGAGGVCRVVENDTEGVGRAGTLGAGHRHRQQVRNAHPQPFYREDWLVIMLRCGHVVRVLNVEGEGL